MPKVAFFVGASSPAEAGPANDNHERLPRAFTRAGWGVVNVDRESLGVEASRLVASTVAGERLALTGFHLYFMLGFGAEATFLDRMQMLRSLAQRRFVNTTDAFIYQHGKVSLLLACPELPQPLTYLSNDAKRLAGWVAEGGDWIVKPPASSFGRGVFRLRERDTNNRAILEHLTRGGRYALLQEYVDPGEEDEKRLLIVAGRVLGVYGRRPVDHRGNLCAGAAAFAAELRPNERRIAGVLAAKLDALGVRFAAADLVGAKVLEINVANPGWLGTYEPITGEDLAGEVVRALSSLA